MEAIAFIGGAPPIQSVLAVCGPRTTTRSPSGEFRERRARKRNEGPCMPRDFNMVWVHHVPPRNHPSYIIYIGKQGSTLSGHLQNFDTPSICALYLGSAINHPRRRIIQHRISSTIYLFRMVLHDFGPCQPSPPSHPCAPRRRRRPGRLDDDARGWDARPIPGGRAASVRRRPVYGRARRGVGSEGKTDWSWGDNLSFKPFLAHSTYIDFKERVPQKIAKCKVSR